MGLEMRTFHIGFPWPQPSRTSRTAAPWCEPGTTGPPRKEWLTDRFPPGHTTPQRLQETRSCHVPNGAFSAAVGAGCGSCGPNGNAAQEASRWRNVHCCRRLYDLAGAGATCSMTIVNERRASVAIRETRWLVTRRDGDPVFFFCGARVWSRDG